MNGKKLFTILFLSLLILGCNQNTKQAGSTGVKSDTLCTIDDKHWKITVNNGKGSPNSVYSVVPTAGMMDNYLQNVSIIDGELAYTLSENKTYASHLSKDSLTVDSIGVWGNYTVYQVSNFYVMHRSILLKYADDKYRILYTESDHVGSPLTGTLIYNETNGNKPLSTIEIAKELRPNLSERNGKQILNIKHLVGGNSEYYGRYLYEIDEKTRLPQEMNQ